MRPAWWIFKNRLLRRLALMFFLVSFCLSLATFAPAGAEELNLPEGAEFIWYNGDRIEHVWLSWDEAVIFPGASSQKTFREDLRAAIPWHWPGAQIVDENETRVFLEIPAEKDLLFHETRLMRFDQFTGLRSYPVFYPGYRDSRTRMALTGEIIVHFKPGWAIEQIDSWADRYGLVRLKTFSFSPSTFLFQAGEGFRSLRVANEIYLSGEVVYAYPNWLHTRVPRATPNDPLFSSQWHLQNTGQGGGTPGEDVNIVAVWDTYLGSANQVIAVVDDGLEIGHEDLSANVQSMYCYDYVDGDSNPTGGAHGTSVAGVAAARGWNSLGVTGAAPTGGLVGYRLLGAENDANEADALTLNNQIVDIYSNSWGPYDDGQRLEGPGPLTMNALIDGVTNGREGKGNIYVWAGGNGYDTDNSNYDGYANSRYTIAVAASTNYGERASYSEKGANIFVNAPSNGGSLGITTTDRTGALGYSSGNYTSSFGGTSSAAPLVSGIIALMLQANSDLTWRDVQHILITTAEKNDPTDADWTTNGAGHLVNHKFGFGRIDAQAAINAALSWTSEEDETKTSIVTSSPNLAIPDNSSTGVSATIEFTENLIVEYVDVFFSATDHHRWGDLQIELTSPSGTRSILAEKHNSGTGGTYYNWWKFGSVRHFGEPSEGTWTLTVKDLAASYTGTFQSWGIAFYGIDVTPPSGSVVINNNDMYTNTTSVTLGFSASDISGVSQVCTSNTTGCTSWVPYGATKSWSLQSGEGTKTVYAWFQDGAGNTSLEPASDSITLDVTPPSDGNLSASAGSSRVVLTWSGFSDTLSGIRDYRLVYSTSAPPASCREGTPLYRGVNTSYTHRDLTNATYYYRVCAVDRARNVSTGATASATVQGQVPGASGTISLQSPSDHSVFNTCSLADGQQPTFTWTSYRMFERYEILFAVSPGDFGSPIVEENIPGGKNGWRPSARLWRDIMASSWNNGAPREVCWKVIGTRSDRTRIESQVRTIRAGDPEPVTLHRPVDGATFSSRESPIFEFDPNCNTTFVLEFSPLGDFSDPEKIKRFSLLGKQIRNPGFVHGTLTVHQWGQVVELMGDGMGYFRVKASDPLGRDTFSEVRSFLIQSRSARRS